MKQKFGHKSESLLRYFLAGLKEAKNKWTVRYNCAVKEDERLNALQQINFYASEIEAYSKMLKEGVRV